MDRLPSLRPSPVADAEPAKATAAELREAITNMADTASKMPKHWVDRRGELHRRINLMLDELEQLEAS